MSGKDKSDQGLSKYFANNPPSIFDQISVRNEELQTTNTGVELLTKTNVNLSEAIQLPEFVQPNLLVEDAQKQKSIPDDVKDLWETPYTESGIPPQLTMPGVLSPNELSDPIKDMAYTLLGEADAKQRQFLTANDVTQDERGLRQLIEEGCFRAAVNLTSRLLTIYGQGNGRCGQPAKHTPHSLQLWFTRFALLVKLGQYELCQAEAEAFGNLNRLDVFYEFYPEMYAGRKGSMASFSFRLLLAELHIYLDSIKIAMDRLTQLSEICSQIINYFKKVNNNEAAQFWTKRQIRILHSIINCALLMKDYKLADQLLTVLIIDYKWRKQELRALYSTWGRIYLQCGDIFGAEKKISEARRLKDDPVLDARDLVDKGLIAVAQNDFQEAFGFFQKALTMDPQNTMIFNNMGVCLLYAGKLKEAIAMYETAIHTNPRKGLNENLLLNLCTLYELESSNSRDKKLRLLWHINKEKPDLSISLDSCLKLQSIN